MLKFLKLQNMILIDSCEIEFQRGLNILSGETGAGKTILIQAIALILGKKTDPSVIRNQMDRAIIEAAFEIKGLPKLHAILNASGITFDPDEYLLIKREISKSGNNRTFINSQMVSLSLLVQIGEHLLELVGQSYGYKLKSNETQRETLDTYAKLQKELNQYQLLYLRKTALEKSLSKLNEEKERSNRELDLIKWQHQEISEANLIDNEDDELFSEYTKLAHSQELSVKIQELQDLLTNESNSLAYIQKSLDGLIDKDQQLNTPLENLGTALTHVQEASFFFSHYLDELSVDSSRLDFLEKRLSLIDKLKKKYGSSLAEIKTLEQQLAEKLSSFESIDQKIVDKTLELSKATNEWQTASANLRQKRLAAGKSFGVEVTRQLQALNMIGAIFTVHLEKTAPTLTGEDLISFYLSANPGEKSVPIKDKSSGGELSRMMLTFKTLLVEQENLPTIIFDEIDANIGGETATLVGEKLEQISAKRQVICITHFPQVACKANHHLKIHKEEQDGCTLARITPLDQNDRKQELLRMLGGVTEKLLKE